MSTGSLSTPPVSQTEGTGIDSYQAGNGVRYIALRSSAVKEDPTKLGYNEDSRALYGLMAPARTRMRHGISWRLLFPNVAHMT